MATTAEEPQVEEPEVEPDETEEPVEPSEPDVVEEAQIDFSERAIKAREKSLEREYKRHEGALERAWGTIWEQFVCCPLCEGDGFLVPKPAGSMDPEQFVAVTVLAGQMQTPELPDDQDYVVCVNCQGWGNTNIAGSKREGLSKQCDRCLGQGYTKTTAVNVVPIVPMIPEVTSTAPAPPIPSYGAPGPDDQWGRPTGHAHYGIPPAAVT